ncbi:hypothetical protein Pmar_PMAR019556 [Perkinsus marinus ATCC 50983]|uniref:Uncharacterized protein n=1 Tax=Perkinsus marinus (strain ATCC 50983 / TXsc) TaxID=423536 RepID=C5KPA9_PERM5|nr:hypothetical protein Pmar_PMAR019556 [Perkinsus marinus ATCC 50983]EER13683.1 hypothetical protein Pmar_PMAR019556 [Perkinsus marinus ATCC 50983]|eukprot:XP_002781888.1 hypothetical protein Pmar_PMAR019556 [Perkinsus marinus ATCC 50983]
MGRKSLDPLDPRPYYVKRRDLTSGRVHYHCAVEGCNRKWTCDNVTRLRHHLRCDHEAFELRNVLNKRRAKSPASGRSCGTTVTPIVYDKVKPTVQEPTAPEDLQGVDQPLLESFLVPSPSSKLLGSFHLHLVKSLLAACLPNHAREWLYSVSLKDAFKMLRRGYIPLAKDEFMVLKEAAFRECLESHITELVSAAKRTGQMALILDSSYVTSGETLYSVYGSFKDERHFKVLPFGFYVLADCSEDAAKEKLGNWIKGEIWPELSSNCVRLEAVIHSGGPILEAAALIARGYEEVALRDLDDNELADREKRN